MGFLLSKLVPLALYPLGLALLLQIGGLLARRRRWGRWLSAGGIALLALASMPWVSRQLLWGLEEPAARVTPNTLPQADAVVVLGGGLQPALPPRREVEVNDAGDRLLTGVGLVRTGLAPWLLVSGGRVTFRAGDPSPTEAQSARELALRLGIPAERILLSGKARNTAEEARALERMARARGWRSVLLVTSASHMMRSLSTFRRLTDLRITPVACDFRLPVRRLLGRPTATSVLIDLLPSADALAVTTVAAREHLGQWFYRLRGWM
jgi:uncharacterized SAM-binding protein YcdF (DUF218 family)